MNLNKLNFRQRLIIGFSTILIFSAIIGFLSVNKIQNISKNTKLIYKHPFTVSNSVRDINIYINTIDRFTKDIIFTNDTVQLKQSFHQINYYDSLLHNSFDIVLNRFLGSKEIVLAAEKSYHKWESIRIELINLKNNNISNSILQKTAEKSNNQVEVLLSKTKIMIDFAQNKANEYYFKTKKDEESSLMFFIINISLLLIISFFIALIISNSISNPLKKIISEIKNVSNEEKINKKELRKKTEQELLSEAVTKLKEAYEKKTEYNLKLKTFNQALEKKVVERTKDLAKSEIILKKKNEDLKKQKQKAEEIKKNFEIMIEKSPLPMVITDKNQNIEFFNAKFTELFGYTTNDISTAEQWWEIAYPDQNYRLIIQKNWTTAINIALQNNVDIKVQRWFLTIKDRTKRYCEFHMLPLKKLSLIIINDITDQREFEEKLKQTNEEFETKNEELRQANEELLVAKEKAEESEKLKSAFLANMSHEIRTPMNGIIGFADMMKKTNITEEKRKYYAEIISSSSEQLLSIINDILDISKIETGQMKLNITNSNVNNMIDSLFTIYELQSNKLNINIYSKKQLNDKQSTVFLDELKVRQVLNNLISNALKFTTQGYIEFGYNLKNNFLEFYVKDTGVGIKTEYQDKIFERFRQGEANLLKYSQGTGLGLAISKALVKLMEGEIWLESEENKGSCFYFKIFYNQAYKEEIKINNEFTILIAEDEEVNYLFLEEVLKNIDVNLLHAKNGKEAIDFCMKNDKIKLILMDIKMPVMNGYEAIENIKKIRPEIPIIAQTACAMSEDREKAIKSGCKNYLAKPINEKELLKLVKEYMP